MAPSKHTRPILLVLALAAVGGAVLLFALGGGGREAEEEGSPVVRVRASEPEKTAPEPRTDGMLIPLPVADVRSGEVPDTTVLWPLRIELDLLQASYLPTQEDVSPVGTGATAKFKGRITGSSDEGVQARIEFVAGPNTGRQLIADVTGSFGATDLYPGLSIVEVRADGIVGSRREVRLRQNKETLLNIGYGRPGIVSARVQDSKGNGIEGASVTIDGTRTVSGVDGDVYISGVASGQVLVEVEKEGYAAYQELNFITAGRMTDKKRMTFTLQPSTSMILSVKDRIGGPGPVQVYLLPAQSARRVSVHSAHRNQRYPWHKLNPIEVWPGTPKTVEGLPAEVVKVFAFRAGATAPQKVVNLRPGRPYPVEIPLQASDKITGKVTLDGEPVSGAKVRLEAPNRVRATLGFFREPSYFLETGVMPSLPPALQEVETNFDGRFVLTAWSELTEVRYVEATGPNQSTWAGKLVQRGENVVDLELEEVNLADSVLELSFPNRWQALPVEVIVDGAPLGKEFVPAHETLRIKPLRSGRWRLRTSWHSEPVSAEEDLEISGVTPREIQLPREAIDGQDEETWLRAGKEFPFGG